MNHAAMERLVRAENLALRMNLFLSQHKKSQPERREHLRFGVKKGVLAVSDKYVGQITDISVSGLSFRIVHFCGQTKNANNRPEDIESLDILSSALEGFALKNLPVTTVFDQKLGPIFPDKKEIVAYRRGVQFSALSVCQAEQLQELIIAKNDGNKMAPNIPQDHQQRLCQY